jgi:hypothetical protein
LFVVGLHFCALLYLLQIFGVQGFSRRGAKKNAKEAKEKAGKERRRLPAYTAKL